MKHAETKINIHESTIKNRMQHQPTEQALVFKLAAAAPLKRPYGNYGRHRVKAKKHKQPNTQSKLSATQAQGQRYEALAIDFLKAQGLLLLAKNLRCKVGEIDCLMLDAQTLVFVEIRQRSYAYYGGAAASINQQKQLRIKLAANYFLPQICHRLGLKQMPYCRFDSVTFDGKKQDMQWLKNAFS
ncbi:YraN family protein [Oligella urethralis]|uniref:YraN family protein n=1 Tax=Oligella urethralis TaxID=90245 RepID=UPI000E075217|nr:YraN family protein [Oligella urethralis]SUA55328.1 Uncharacterised protein family UPF0102 [Oligella urethralis]